MKHTPGPWTARKFGDTKSHTIYAFDGTFSLASVKHIDPQEQEANAQLIAAAPELLAAAQAIERVAKGAMFPGPVHLSFSEIKALRKAIAKATGEEA